MANPQQKLLEDSKPNLICNFRAPSLKEFEDWHKYKLFVKEQGLDVCRVTLGLTNAFMLGQNVASQTPGRDNNITVQMSNQFLYQVSKPRREPFSLNCVKPEFRRTFSSILFEAYVLDKARRKLRGEFSFKDFLELDHHSFRRIIGRLSKKGLIVRIPQRTIPRMYLLAENIEVT